MRALPDSFLILSVAVTLVSVAFHEFAHGYAAYLQGDLTAKYEGRLTVNPLKHLDMVGSIIVPALLLASGSPAFGWAKPVPYNPYNLRNRRWGAVAVAAAGPLSNLALALVFSLVFRSLQPGSPYAEFSLLVVWVNAALFLFNLMPVPPFDGAKILGGFLGRHGRWLIEAPLSTALALALVAAFFIWPIISPLVGILVLLLTGGGFGA
jgi:Zn-dependent protease